MTATQLFMIFCASLAKNNESFDDVISICAAGELHDEPDIRVCYLGTEFVAWTDRFVYSGDNGQVRYLPRRPRKC